ncbi:MAG: permease prefix domain 1-containing protein [Longimicrobiales bacterium]
MRGLDDLADFDEEVEFHLEMQTQRYIEGGMTPEQAHYIKLSYRQPRRRR